MVEDVLMAVGEKVSSENTASASLVNKTATAFHRGEQCLVKSPDYHGIVINDMVIHVSPCLPPLERSQLQTAHLFCLMSKNPALKHVTSSRRQDFMFLDSPDSRKHTLDISLRVKHKQRAYMIYVSIRTMECLECGDIGHNRRTGPHRGQEEESPNGCIEASGGGRQP